MLGAMKSLRNALLLAVVAAIAAAGGYWTYAGYQKRSQQKAIAALVGQGTAELQAALGGKPTDENLKNIEAALTRLRATPASRQIDFAGATDAYLVSARAIVLRRSDAVRLAPQAEERNKELVGHMSGPRGRDDGWIRRATELKKQSDQANYDLALAQRTLADLLEDLPGTEQRLEAYVPKSAVLDEALREAAIKQAREDIRRATDALATQLQMLLPR
jgi:hypothetical protein